MQRAALLVALGATFLPALPARAGTPTAKLSPAALAARIDEHLAARWKERKAVPAAPADDAELVRRLHLDLTGRIPDILAARDFADNPSANKTARLIDALLESDRYAIHFANVWRAWLLPDSNDSQVMYLVPGFETWLRDQLRSNSPYDHLVRAMIDTSRTGMAGAGALYQAHQFKPESMAAATSRLFLGVKLECAQCHKHPFARWTRKQFWELAAFFSGAGGRLTPRAQGSPTVAPGEAQIPGTDTIVKARFLDGKAPRSSAELRAELANWITAKDNPYFARAVSNRLWEYLMGTGLVEPVDEETLDNPPSHPELMTLLAEQLVANDHDLKYLLRAIVSSRSYQLSSKQTHASQADERLFARRRVRGMSPEQLFDSLALATGQKDDLPGVNLYGLRGVNFATPRADFLRRFPNQDKRTEQQVSILQALYLMNGKIVAEATSLEHNKNLAIIGRATTVRTARRIEQLFLIALNRKPTAAERDRFVKYVDGGGPSKDAALALCDVFWALLNSSEFCVNH
jgi:hypothetical protein